MLFPSTTFIEFGFVVLLFHLTFPYSKIYEKKNYRSGEVKLFTPFIITCEIGFYFNDCVNLYKLGVYYNIFKILNISISLLSIIISMFIKKILCCIILLLSCLWTLYNYETYCMTRMASMSMELFWFIIMY